MTFLRSSRNVFEYLVRQGLCTKQEQNLGKVERKDAKNFNLLLNLRDGRRLLVKQERHNRDGKTAGEFLNEWRIKEFLQRFLQLSHIRPMLWEALRFYAQHSVIIFNYLNDYGDLADFYTKENVFSTDVVASIGTTLAKVHPTTLDRQEYQDFFSQNHEDVSIDKTPSLIRGLERISPEIFGLVPADGLKFFALYQRYDSLGKAIAQLATAFESCCLTHNDFKLNNILLHSKIEEGLFSSLLSLKPVFV